VTPLQYRRSALVEAIQERLGTLPSPDRPARPGPVQGLSATPTPTPDHGPTRDLLISACRDLAELVLPDLARDIQDDMALRLLGVCMQYQRWAADRR